MVPSLTPFYHFTVIQLTNQLNWLTKGKSSADFVTIFKTKFPAIIKLSRC